MMGIDKPFHRTIRSHIPSPNAGYSAWAYIRDKEYAQNPANYLRAYFIIEGDFEKLCEYIEPSPESLTTYSYRIDELLMLICIEVEANFKAILSENINSIQQLNMGVYRKIDVSHHLSSYELILPTWHGQSASARGDERASAQHRESTQRHSVEATLHIDPTLLSPASALLGALIGSGTSLLAAIYTQRYQDRLQRIAGEVAKRETVYADFLMSASNWLLNAFVHDEISVGGDEQRLIGLINRMRLFAPNNVVSEAEAVLRAIVEIALKPRVELRQLAKEALSKSLDPDPLLAFSSTCRADLDHVRRTGT